MYEWTGAVWNLVGEPIEFGDVSFNFRISGDGNRVVCGTRGEFVRVYGYSVQDNQWQQVGQDILPSQDVLDLEFRSFPSSLAISHTGDRFAFSFAPEIRLQGSAITFDQMFGIGRVWIYELDSTSGTWEVVGDGEPLRDENSPWFGANLESTYVFLTQAKQAAFVWVWAPQLFCLTPICSSSSATQCREMVRDWLSDKEKQFRILRAETKLA